MSAPAVPPIEELLRHARWIEELARRLVRDPAAADDLAQSAWIVALRETDRTRSNVRGWLSSVVRNLARERHRREAQREPVERRGARREALPSPVELLERAEAEKRVVECVTQLDEPHRTTLLLRYFEGLWPGEIARREGVPLATITHRITRAHARLREQLSDEREHGGWLAALAPILDRREVAPITELSTMKLFTLLSLAGAMLVVVLVVNLTGSSASSDAPSDALAGDAGGTKTASLPVLEKTERSSAVAMSEPRTSSEIVSAAAPVATPVASKSRLHGRVLRPDGSSAAKRKVRLLHLVAKEGKGQGERYVECDESGTFDAPELGAGTWSVATWPDESELTGIGLAFDGTLAGMAYLAERTIDLDDGRSVELVLGAPPERPIRVRGRVLLEGVEAELQAVQFLPAGEGTYDLKKNARTIDGHSYETVLEKPGRYHVMASLPGARPDWILDVPDARELELDLVVPPNVVHGRVVDTAGKPVRNASVELSVRGGRRAPLLFSSLSLVRGTEGDGTFRFFGLDAADYVVTVNGGKLGEAKAPGGTVVSSVVRARPEKEFAPLELTLAVGRMVPLRILDAKGAERSSVAFVFDASGNPLNAISGATRGKVGELTTIPLAPGRYSAVAAAGSNWSRPTEFVVTAEGELGTVELALQVACELVVDARGVPSTLVEVVDDAGRKFGSLLDKMRFSRAVERNWDSDAPLLRLPPGNYSVHAVGVDGARASARIALVAGEAQKVKLSP